MRKINVATAEVTLFAGSPTGLTGLPGNAQGTNALFNCPSGVAVNPAGTVLYVSEQGNHVIRSITDLDTVRNVFTFVGKYTGSGGSADGTAGNVQFNQPNGLSFLPGGATLFVADLGGSTIRSIDMATTTTTTLAGQYLALSRVDGVGSSAKFKGPTDVAVDPLGELLFVADRGSNVVRAVNISSALVTTLAGPPLGTDPGPGSADGVRALATFNGPGGLCVNPANTVVYDTDQ